MSERRRRLTRPDPKPTQEYRSVAAQKLMLAGMQIAESARYSIGGDNYLDMVEFQLNLRDCGVRQYLAAARRVHAGRRAGLTILEKTFEKARGISSTEKKLYPRIITSGTKLGKKRL